MTSESLFKKYETRWLINGDRLRELREQYGLSQQSFAVLAGWSRSYQQKLEGQPNVSVPDADATIIRTILERPIIVDCD